MFFRLNNKKTSKKASLLCFSSLEFVLPLAHLVLFRGSSSHRVVILQSQKLIMILHRFACFHQEGNRGGAAKGMITGRGENPRKPQIFDRNNRQKHFSVSVSLSLLSTQYARVNAAKIRVGSLAPPTPTLSRHALIVRAAHRLLWRPTAERTLVFVLLCCYRDSVLIIHCIESSSLVLSFGFFFFSVRFSSAFSVCHFQLIWFFCFFFLNKPFQFVCSV